MNKAKLLKNLAIAIFVPSVIAVGYFGYKYYKRRKDAPSREQLDELIKAFTRSESDVLTGWNQKIYDRIMLPSFMTNITTQEADEMIAIGNKDFEQRTEEEKTKTLNFFPRLLGSTNISALGFPYESPIEDKYEGGEKVDYDTLIDNYLKYNKELLKRKFF